MYQTTEIKLFKVIAFDEKQGSFTSTSSSKVLFIPLLLTPLEQKLINYSRERKNLISATFFGKIDFKSPIHKEN